MNNSSIQSLKIRAKLLQKAKKKAGQDFALKDAYELIAEQSGYSSWRELKKDFELADLLNPPQWSAIWKIWFKTREEALTHFEDHLFLLPYKNQFFLCDVNYIHSLGIEDDDEDFKNVGRDWTRPKNSRSLESLLKKIKK